MITPVQAISVIEPSAVTISTAPANAGFLEQLNDTVKASGEVLSDIAAGKAVPTHELMLSLELARQQLQLAVEVRNKLVDAYQELMRMQM